MLSVVLTSISQKAGPPEAAIPLLLPLLLLASAFVISRYGSRPSFETRHRHDVPPPYCSMTRELASENSVLVTMPPAAPFCARRASMQASMASWLTSAACKAVVMPSGATRPRNFFACICCPLLYGRAAGHLRVFGDPHSGLP